MAAMGDRCATISPPINDSLIHDTGILNPVISMYPLFQNQYVFDTVTEATGLAYAADTGDADIPLT
jgi:hypothetical protein